MKLQFTKVKEIQSINTILTTINSKNVYRVNHDSRTKTNLSMPLFYFL